MNSLQAARFHCTAAEAMDSDFPTVANARGGRFNTPRINKIDDNHCIAVITDGAQSFETTQLRRHND